MIQKAIDFARAAHEGQVRKFTGEPYVNHVIEVRDILLETVPDADEAMQVAAILHDVVEDTPVTLEKVKKEFGPDVASMVDDLTDRYTKEAHPHMNRRLRKEAEAMRLKNTSGRVQTIKLADLISNTRSIVQHDEGFAKVYLPEKARILQYLTRADPEMQTRAFRSLTRSLSVLNLRELHSEGQNNEKLAGRS